MIFRVWLFLGIVIEGEHFPKYLNPSKSWKLQTFVYFTKLFIILQVFKLCFKLILTGTQVYLLCVTGVSRVVCNRGVLVFQQPAAAVVRHQRTTGLTNTTSRPSSDAICVISFSTDSWGRVFSVEVGAPLFTLKCTAKPQVSLTWDLCRSVLYIIWFIIKFIQVLYSKTQSELPYILRNMKLEKKLRRYFSYNSKTIKDFDSMPTI